MLSNYELEKMQKEVRSLRSDMDRVNREMKQIREQLYNNIQRKR